MTGPATVVFDLDGVITSRDTFATVVTRRLVRAPWRLVLALPALPLMAVTAGRPQWRGLVARYLVRVALLGSDLDRVGDEVSRLAAEFARTPDWLCPVGVEAARRHLAAGDRVVVLTATERTLARTLLDELGLGDAELLASGLVRAPGGVRMHPHNYGVRKLEALRAAGVPRPWTVMYTDSWADRPTLAEVQQVVLVRPTPRLLERARSTWPGKVTAIR
jgi:phosphatidylglycerophosphatase C